MEQLRKTGFLSKLEAEQEKVIKDVISLDQDRSNFAVFCWKDMNEYHIIKKNALAHKVKAKAMKDKNTKDMAFKLKQISIKYAKE